MKSRFVFVHKASSDEAKVVSGHYKHTYIFTCQFAAAALCIQTNPNRKDGKAEMASSFTLLLRFAELEGNP